MKKGLMVIPALAVLLAVSCGDKPSVKKFPTKDIIDFYADFWEMEVSASLFPSYAPKSTKVKYTVDTEWTEYTGAIDVYVENTSHEECEAYIISMVSEEVGWTLVDTHDYGDGDKEYYLQYVTGGAFDLSVQVSDYVTSNEYVDIQIGATQHVEEETYTQFPLELVNEFLTTYELGFTLTAGFDDPAGNGYTVSTFIDDVYHGMKIAIDGDQYDVLKTFFADYLTTGGYSLGGEQTSSCYYVNEDNHEIDFAFEAGSDESDPGVTSVTLWE